MNKINTPDFYEDNKTHKVDIPDFYSEGSASNNISPSCVGCLSAGLCLVLCQVMCIGTGEGSCPDACESSYQDPCDSSYQDPCEYSSQSSASLVGTGVDWIDVYISGLQYPSNQYDEFSIAVYRGGSYVKGHSWGGYSSSTNTIGRVTGLQSSTQYYLEIYAKWSGVNYFVNGLSATTKALPTPPSAPSTSSVTDVGTNHVSLSWSSVSNADTYIIRTIYNGVVVQTSSTGATSATITGLSPNTVYVFRIYSRNAGGESSNYNTNAATTLSLPPTTPSISLHSKTPTSVTLNLYSSGATSYETQYRINGATTWTPYWGEIYNPLTISGLTSGKTYDFRARAVNSGGTSSYSSVLTVDVGYARPDNWEWEYTISQGGKFYSYAQGGKRVNLMRAAHWNEFTARIKLFRDYKGLSSYTFTTATTNTTPTGVRNCINEAINAINPMLSTAQRMNTIGVGDKVTAKIFTDFVAKIKLI